MNKQDVGEKPQSKAASKVKSKKDIKVRIALLGVTGAGKSTFINVASGRDELKISHGSKPCK
jgi:ATPase subunit of ABC transporter with duplicated ATPase domains